MYVVCWMLRTSDWIQNSVEKLCCTCWYAKLSKTVWIIHCFCLVNYYVIMNLFLDQCYFLCHVTSYIGWEIKFAFKWNLNFILLQVIIIRGLLCKSLAVVLKNKFHYYFCYNVWYHSKVNKSLLIILIKSSNFVQFLGDTGYGNKFDFHSQWYYQLYKFVFIACNKSLVRPLGCYRMLVF